MVNNIIKYIWISGWLLMEKLVSENVGTVLAHELQHAWDGVYGKSVGHIEETSYGRRFEFDAEHEFTQ